ncbi:tRNA 5-carboxymethoxyuridine methyltransferase [Sporomusa rhizae]|uniref:sigma-70 family RNA polymerase sigma factor n=1 Tax=Sporomusa rhizae TaxID=357999 RepID=UPI00352B09D2
METMDRDRRIELLEDLFRKMYPKLYRFLYWKLQDGNVAEDITQETFVRACTQLNNKAVTDNVSAWLFTIARNLCLDYWRKNGRRLRETPIYDELSPHLVGTQKDLLENMLEQQGWQIVIEALSTLKLEHKKAIILRHFEDCSYEQSARQLGITVPAFTSLLNRARSKFFQAIVSQLSPKTAKKRLGHKECFFLLKYFGLDWPENPDIDITQRSKMYFDNYAYLYEKDRHLSYPQSIDQALLARVDWNSKVIGVDFGTGLGHTAEKMSSRLDRVYAFDISANMLNLAKARLNQLKCWNIKLAIGDLSTVLSINQADLATCVCVLHHILDPGKAIQVMARSLKPNGVLIIADFGRHHQDCFNYSRSDVWLGFHPQQLTRWLKEAGLNHIWVKEHDDLCFSFCDSDGHKDPIPLIMAGASKA